MDGFNLRHLALAVALSAGMGSAFAATDNDFVDNAAAGGIAEIETSKLALEKSQSADIKAFANQMIADHTKANEELKKIATTNDIEVPDELFKKQANTVTDDKAKGATELKAFAQKMLPALEKHLAHAKELQAKHPSK